ncbi:MAG: aminotransferase class I/II-fold pyridoxal phosphate-dependent enzyme [Chitinophagales bacterium]|nr:aminotransferase class I/II-fold pyridoxal phosphate-dependent enzyme [Chitinophagales bacterium]
MLPYFVPYYSLDEIELLKKFYLGEMKNIREYEIPKHFTENYNYSNFLLTKSCTQSLELALMSLPSEKGKEIILPSYGFVSLANAVALNGYKCVFVDCEPGTMNVSANAIESAITKDTVAVITINYAGVACDYDKIQKLCTENNLFLIEDNAHGINCKYKDRFLGNLGDISTISFDFLKNISCGEGGGISINQPQLWDNFIKSYHFGTNRQEMLDGKANSYEWKHMGTNSLLAEPLAVILHSQLLQLDKIIHQYLSNWNFYYQELKHLEKEGKIQLAQIPDYAQHNGHLFWMKTADFDERKALIDFLRKNEIGSAFHYAPLHTSEYGMKEGEFRGEDKFTSKESERLLRLPQYYLLKREEQEMVVEKIFEFYS